MSTSQRPQSHAPRDEVSETAEQVDQPRAEGSSVVDDVDELLDEIDEVLEEHAEEFVRGYIQKGGQ